MENKKEQKQVFPNTLTVVGYVCIIISLLIAAPVVCPPIIGQHTYTVGSDYTGLIPEKGTLVYTEKDDKTSIVIGDVVAVDNEDGDRDVDCYYVDSNDTTNQTIKLRDGETVNYDLVKGKIKAKTPFFGYLSGMLFHAWGIILALIIFVAGIVSTIIANKIRKRQKEAALRA